MELGFTPQDTAAAAAPLSFELLAMGMDTGTTLEVGRGRSAAAEARVEEEVVVEITG